jgi:hypothetical protein
VHRRPGPDALRYMSEHSRKQPARRDMTGPRPAKSNSPRVREIPGHGLFSLVVAGARFELAEAEPTVYRGHRPRRETAFHLQFRGFLWIDD